MVIMKYAAAVVVAASGLAYFAVVPLVEAAAFAEVAQKLRDPQTLSYRIAVKSPDLKVPLTMRVYFKKPVLFRSELEGGIVTIADASRGKQLILNPADKTALLLEGKAQDAPPGQAASLGLVDRLRQLTEEDAKAIGNKKINKIQTRGYLVKNKKFGTEMTVWVNLETRLPVQIDSVDVIQGKTLRTTTSDFQVNPDLEDELFQVDPPAGYTLRKAESDVLGMDEKKFLNPEEATAALLRIFAESHGGAFPKRLDDFNEFDDKEKQKTRKRGVLPDPETLRTAQALTRFLMATRPLKGEFGYRSEGVKLGDADKILFWYRPEGAENYRVIYGDLHVADEPEAKLPKNSKP